MDNTTKEVKKLDQMSDKEVSMAMSHLAMMHGSSMLMIEWIDNIENIEELQFLWEGKTRAALVRLRNILMKKAEMVYDEMSPEDEKPNNELQNTFESSIKQYAEIVTESLMK